MKILSIVQEIYTSDAKIIVLVKNLIETIGIWDGQKHWKLRCDFVILSSHLYGSCLVYS